LFLLCWATEKLAVAYYLLNTVQILSKMTLIKIAWPASTVSFFAAIN